MQQRQFVEHVGKPLRLGLPVDVQAPQGVLQRLATHSHLRRQGLFAQVLQRTTNLEVLREVVLPIDAEHALSLHAVVVVAFQRDVDVCACVDDALIEDGHFTGRVVHGIVAAFGQQHAASRHADRALRHIIGS